ncbi:MAG: hypothetical protein ACXQTW_04655 [Candidatus Methanospirareceae archaeon]
MEVISQRLNGTSKIISFPFFQSKVLVEIPKTRTTLAVLKTLVDYVEKYDIRLFLIVIDLEHFTGGIISDIEEKLTSLGMSIDGIEMLNPSHEDALRVEGRSKSGRDFIALIQSLRTVEEIIEP